MLGLRLGRGGFDAADGLGAMLGFGLADLDERLLPLARPRFDWAARASWAHAARWTGSEFAYDYALARWDAAYTWGEHRSVLLRAAAGAGDSLPANRLLATGPEAGLVGLYAREFRGDAVAGAGVGFSRSFRRTRRGLWQATAFVESARAWSGGRGAEKSGAGVSAWYRFWRFPLPLGLAYTYCLDDRDSQVSGAIGGRF